MKATGRPEKLAVYSVYWNDRRVVVVRAPSEEAVENLIDRHTCEDETCQQCSEYTIMDGTDGTTRPTLRIREDGKFLRGFVETAFAALLFWPLIFRWLAGSTQEPKNQYWEPHP